MKNILLGVTGGISAYKSAEIINRLKREGFNVYVVMTENAKEFITPLTLEVLSKNKVITSSFDQIEGDPIPHIFLANKCDLVLIAPGTANVISKLANGIADDVLTTTVLATNSKILIAPAMNTNMYNNKMTQENIKKLTNIGYYFIEPEIGNLACGIEGTGKLSSPGKIVLEVKKQLNDSVLKDRKILVTAGPTPVKIDNVRRMTNKFSGKLGIEIAKELYLRNADVTLLQSYSGIRPPKYIKHILFDGYDEYRDLCIEHSRNNEIGIFSAAVADYKPSVIHEGKLPSGSKSLNLELIPTEKVIDLVRKANPSLRMISFKYEEGKTLEELQAIAEARLKSGHLRVITNDLTLNTENQKCFLCGLEDNHAVVLKESKGKENIAKMIADDIEKILIKE